MSDSFIIADRETFNRKISLLINGGASNLHVVSDYDKTLTKKPSEKNSNCYAKLGLKLGNDYHRKDAEMFKFYYPIEISTKIPFKEKREAMHEWWEKHFRLVMDSGLNKGLLDDLIDLNLDSFREGTETFFEILSKNEVPLLVFSAGIGNLIEGSLKKNHFLTKKTYIVSNFYDFDNDGKCIGFSKDLITSIDKKEFVITNSSYLREITGRKNVILLGDSEGDIHMAEGIDHDLILKIGFLVEYSEERLKLYEKLYDIVILDGSFNEVNNIFTRILSSKLDKF